MRLTQTGAAASAADRMILTSVVAVQRLLFDRQRLIDSHIEDLLAEGLKGVSAGAHDHLGGFFQYESVDVFHQHAHLTVFISGGGQFIGHDPIVLSGDPRLLGFQLHGSPGTHDAGVVLVQAVDGDVLAAGLIFGDALFVVIDEVAPVQVAVLILYVGLAFPQAVEMCIRDRFMSSVTIGAVKE